MNSQISKSISSNKPTEFNNFPFIMIRLWPQHHNDEKEFNELYEVLKRYRATCDEVWFCTEIGFPKLEVHKESAIKMATAASKIRELGILTGLQIANTLGHGGLNLLQDDSGADWPMMVGHDGKIGAPCPCPRAPESLKYQSELAKLYASWQPSSIWIDDDLRMSRHGAVVYGCFCSLCLMSFSQIQKKEWHRESLVAALHQKDAGKLRIAWTNFNAESLACIATEIGKSVYKIAPNCRLGLQQIGHEAFMYSGPNWNPMLDSLARESGRNVGARLGHGFYQDQKPRQMIVKSNLIGRQVVRLSGNVNQICAEIDNYTHNAFGKSGHGMAVESTLDIAMGCNSLSYAILCSSHEPMSWYETLFKKISEYKPFWLHYNRLNANTEINGLEMVLSLNHVGRAIHENEPLFAWSEINTADKATEMQCLGIPLMYESTNSSGYFLKADVIPGLTDSELQKILNAGAMLDGLAAYYIQERGLGEYLGATIEKIEAPIPYIERFSNDQLNGIFANKIWRGFPNESKVFSILPDTEKILVLGCYEDRFCKLHGNATVLLENNFGGRIAIFGYYGWEDTPSGGKRNQYQIAADWVSKNNILVKVNSISPIMIVPRKLKTGQLKSIMVLNTSIEALENFELILKVNTISKITWHIPNCNPVNIAFNSQNGYIKVNCPGLAGWSCGLLEFE